MASLGTQWLTVNPKNGIGEPYSYKADVTVDKEGIFSVSIPEELVDTAEQMVKKQEVRHFSLHKLKVRHVITGREKGKCLAFIRDIIQDFQHCEVTSEIVIAYRTSSGLTYWKKGSGEIVPNGSYDHKGYEDGSGSFQGSNNATKTTNTFSVGIAARVYEKLTAHTPSGDKVTYKVTYGAGTHHDRDTWLQKLNSFNGINTVHSNSDTKEMPYTEEAARFFYESMIGLCKLSDRIEMFFSSPGNVQQAIEAKQGYFLSAGLDTTLPDEEISEQERLENVIYNAGGRD
jgi:hypothetical protein